jgi:hypothetical protein
MSKLKVITVDISESLLKLTEDCKKTLEEDIIRQKRSLKKRRTQYKILESYFNSDEGIPNQDLILILKPYIFDYSNKKDIITEQLNLYSHKIKVNKQLSPLKFISENFAYSDPYYSLSHNRQEIRKIEKWFERFAPVDYYNNNKYI